MSTIREIRTDFPDIGETIIWGQLSTRERIRSVLRHIDPLNTALRWRGNRITSIWLVMRMPLLYWRYGGEPLFKNPSEECVYGFLVQYIGNLRRDGVRDFLRFVTGSSALVNDINIYFNGLEGLSRRPMAGTCSCTLDFQYFYWFFSRVYYNPCKWVIVDRSWMQCSKLATCNSETCTATFQLVKSAALTY